jgi:hypothetical protein
MDKMETQEIQIFHPFFILENFSIVGVFIEILEISQQLKLKFKKNRNLLEKRAIKLKVKVEIRF